MRNKTNLLGILNLTSDSFSDGGEFSEFSNAKNHIDEMISDGCRYIDIGAESTTPGFSDIASDIQIARILPVIKYVKTLSKDIRISIVKRNYQSAVSTKFPLVRRLRMIHLRIQRL